MAESDMMKSNGGGTALLDASLANDSEDWEAGNDEVPDSGALLRKQKPQIHQQNFANFQMVSSILIATEALLLHPESSSNQSCQRQGQIIILLCTHMELPYE